MVPRALTTAELLLQHLYSSAQLDRFDSHSTALCTSPQIEDTPSGYAERCAWSPCPS